MDARRHFPGPDNRYYPLARYLALRFGCRVYRVPLDAGFTCPTRDGSISREGCLYCDDRGAASGTAERGLSVSEQLTRGMEAMRRRYGAEKFFAYFQAFTNTYGPAGKLRRLYAEATAHPSVVGLAIGTRPDCVPDEVLDLIASFAPRLDTWIEYGLQSSHDATLAAIGRGHTAAQFADAIARTRARGIKACAHIILGLPGETDEMMRETARFIAAFPVDGVKIHLLHVLKGSPIETNYCGGGLALLPRERYARLVCDVLELLPPSTVVHRLTGEAPREFLVAPLWALDKHAVLRAIRAELAKRDSYQGKMFKTF